MKRIITFFLLVACVVSISGCGSVPTASNSVPTATPRPMPTPTSIVTPKPEPSPRHAAKSAGSSLVSSAAETITRLTEQAKAAQSGSVVVATSEPATSKAAIDSGIMDGLTLEPITGQFATESDLQFSLFKTVHEIAEQLGWLATPLVLRDTNPELSFDAAKQEVGYARFYLVYYANVGEDEAKQAVEEYTDRLAAVLSVLYPDIPADLVCFFWKIPAISEESLYSASFYYHTENGALVRNSK